MKKMLILGMALLMTASLPLVAKDRASQIIAHRGYWKVDGSAQNSISSLKNTYRIGVYGSEFDVHITRDDSVVVFHDDDIEGIKIENAKYADIKDKRLANGEKIPTLREYVAAAKNLGGMKLILEIKEHILKSDEDRCIDSTLNIIHEANLESRVEYISFSRHACDYLVSHVPGVKVSYLKGDMTPQEVKQAGYTGIDYADKVFELNPSWLSDAKKLGLTTNVWTVNDLKKIKKFLTLGVDYVTTNEPEKAKNL